MECRLILTESCYLTLDEKKVLEKLGFTFVLTPKETGGRFTPRITENLYSLLSQDIILKMTLNSMEDLRRLIKDCGYKVVIDIDDDGDMTIEIYNDYRE